MSARLYLLLKKKMSGHVDVIFCAGDVAIRAAQQATATTPILAVTDDMVGSGLVRSLARPGGNTTGVSILATELDGKRQDILLHAITAPRIVATCQWLARNLPFVDHVALMGLENTGFAIANDDLLWIDPMDYREQLAEAVHILKASKVCVSIYKWRACAHGNPTPTNREVSK